MSTPQLNELLTVQASNEVAVSHRPIALTAGFDRWDIPHWLNTFPPVIGGAEPCQDDGPVHLRPRTPNRVEEPLALAQENEATENIKEFFAAARAENDALGE